MKYLLWGGADEIGWRHGKIWDLDVEDWGGAGVRVEYSKCSDQDERVYRGSKWGRGEDGLECAWPG